MIKILGKRNFTNVKFREYQNPYKYKNIPHIPARGRNNHMKKSPAPHRCGAGDVTYFYNIFRRHYTDAVRKETKNLPMMQVSGRIPDTDSPNRALNQSEKRLNGARISSQIPENAFN